MTRLPRGSRSRGRTAPSCLPPRPASPRSRPRRYRTVVPSLLDPPHQFLESRRRQSHVTLQCRFRLLLKGVKHVDRVGERGDIDHAEGAHGISYADLSNPWADRLHWLPVIRIEAALNPFDLKTRLTTCARWECSHRTKGVAQKRNRFHGGLYISFDIESLS